jgi:hypothetical protein
MNCIFYLGSIFLVLAGLQLELPVQRQYELQNSTIHWLLQHQTVSPIEYNRDFISDFSTG